MRGGPRVTHEGKQDCSWDIRLEGRSWSYDEMLQKLGSLPEKIEISEGKLFFGDEDRLTLLAALLEHLGLEKAVRLGKPALWRQAVAALEETP